MYLDANGTTPCCKEALDAALPFLQSDSGFGNPSTAFGAAPAAALARARAQLAALLRAPPALCDIVFEGSATESINHVIKGLCLARARARAPPGHLVIGATEHVAVLQAARFAEEVLGARVSRVAPARSGAIPPPAVAAALAPDTFLVSVMLANNESGAVSDVAAIARAVRGAAAAAGVPPPFLHCDASQAVGKVEVDFCALGVDALTLAGHKFGAPKGIGATVLLRQGGGGGGGAGAAAALEPLLHGGGQEGGRRAGTENVAYAAALGAAAEAAGAWLAAEAQRSAGGSSAGGVRAALAHALAARCAALGAPPPVLTLAPADPCLPNTLSVAWPGLRSAALRDALAARGVTVAAGAACHSSGSGEPSAVLTAMGVPRAQAQGTLRLSLLRGATAAEAEAAAGVVAEVVAEAAAAAAAAAEAAAKEAGAGAAAAGGCSAADCSASSGAAAAPAPPPPPPPPAQLATEPLFLLDTEAYSAAALPLREAYTLAPGEAPKTPGGPPLPVLSGVILGATVAHAQGGGQPGDRGVLLFPSLQPPRAFCFVTARYAAPPRAPSAIVHMGWWLRPGSAGAAAALGDPAGYAAGLGSSDAAPEGAEEAGEAGGAAGGAAAAAAAVTAATAAAATADCHISAPWRRHCAALHSCGHLLDGAVRRALRELARASPAFASVALVGGKGNHAPSGPPSVEYSGGVPAELLGEFTAALTVAARALVAEGAPTAVVALAGKGEVAGLLAEAGAGEGAGEARGLCCEALRGMDFGGFAEGRQLRLVAVGGAFNVCPCGGTHVKSAAQLAQLVIGKVTSKKGVTKITYTCDL